MFDPDPRTRLGRWVWQVWAGGRQPRQPRSRAGGPSDSPAGQDPHHVAGLVAFNTDGAVVEVGLCLLQQRKHTWAYCRGVSAGGSAQATR